MAGDKAPWDGMGGAALPATVAPKGSKCGSGHQKGPFLLGKYSSLGEHRRKPSSQSRREGGRERKKDPFSPDHHRFKFVNPLNMEEAIIHLVPGWMQVASSGWEAQRTPLSKRQNPPLSISRGQLIPNCSP